MRLDSPLLQAPAHDEPFSYLLPEKDQGEPLSPGASDSLKIGRIVDDLTETGISVCDDFIPAHAWQRIAAYTRQLVDEGAFSQARIGHNRSLKLDSALRSDRTCWIDTDAPSAELQPCLHRLESLRQEINRQLFLGLFELEAHLAHYPPGASYGLHYDRFIGTSERMVTVILYLNNHWHDSDAGELVIHPGNLAYPALPMKIAPVGGRLVAFISERFPHEVLPARSDRLSLSGWFRHRP